MEKIVIRRVLSLALVGYLLSAFLGRLLEAVGAARCGCGPSCWCRQPILSAFRWVFPWRHQ
jgi:hypothetical protein